MNDMWNIYTFMFTFSMTTYSSPNSSKTWFFFYPVLPVAGDEVRIGVTLAYYSDGSLWSTYELCNSHMAYTTIPDNDSSVEIHSIISPVPGFISKSSDRGSVGAWGAHTGVNVVFLPMEMIETTGKMRWGKQICHPIVWHKPIKKKFSCNSLNILLWDSPSHQHVKVSAGSVPTPH